MECVFIVRVCETPIFRKYDYENFLATLLLPKTARRAAFAIRAFNVEIAQVCTLRSTFVTEQYFGSILPDPHRIICEISTHNFGLL